jgi:hypothetical protein
MCNFKPKRTKTATRGVETVLCILAIFIGITMTGQNEIYAQDKSTSITCTGAGPCEKTECINGDCETIATNSSNISSTSGSDGKESDNNENSISDSLRERLSMRED